MWQGRNLQELLGIRDQPAVVQQGIEVGLQGSQEIVRCGKKAGGGGRPGKNMKRGGGPSASKPTKKD